MQRFEKVMARRFFMMLITAVAGLFTVFTPGILLAEKPVSAVKPYQIRMLTVRVIDADRRPITGVRIYQNHIFIAETAKKHLLENSQHTTDARGIAVLELKGKNDDLRLWVSKDKYSPLHAWWARDYQTDGGQVPDEFTFQLERGTSIGGTINDEQGQPIAGVRVAVENLTSITPLGMFDNTPLKPGIRPEPRHWLAEEDDVVTDADGRWQLNNVPADDQLNFHPRVRAAIPSAPELGLKVSHPDFQGDIRLGQLQRQQGITLESLRNQTATIVLQRR